MFQIHKHKIFTMRSKRRSDCFGEIPFIENSRQSFLLLRIHVLNSVIFRLLLLSVTVYERRVAPTLRKMGGINTYKNLKATPIL